MNTYTTSPDSQQQSLTMADLEATVAKLEAMKKTLLYLVSDHLPLVDKEGKDIFYIRFTLPDTQDTICLVHPENFEQFSELATSQGWHLQKFQLEFKPLGFQKGPSIKVVII